MANSKIKYERDIAYTGLTLNLILSAIMAVVGFIVVWGGAKETWIPMEYFEWMGWIVFVLGVLGIIGSLVSYSKVGQFIRKRK